MGRKESNQTKQNILYEFQGMPSDDLYLPRYGLNPLLYGNTGEHSDPPPPPKKKKNLIPRPKHMLWVLKRTV